MTIDEAKDNFNREVLRIAGRTDVDGARLAMLVKQTERISEAIGDSVQVIMWQSATNVLHLFAQK